MKIAVAYPAEFDVNAHVVGLAFRGTTEFVLLEFSVGVEHGQSHGSFAVFDRGHLLLDIVVS